MKMKTQVITLSVVLFFLALSSSSRLAAHQSPAPPTPNNSGVKDPGVRAANVNAGTPLSTLTPGQLLFFNDGQTLFQQVDQVATGLGPTFNSNSCSSCHSQPAVGGSSP